MSNFSDDPLKIIPKDFTNNGAYKIVKFIAPDNASPKDFKITVRFSFGSEMNYGYLRVLREYLNTLNIM
jgi:ATP-dependent RNA circularization protein (DNA/RNA ligase family)